jgi:hypothetical protein
MKQVLGALGHQAHTVTLTLASPQPHPSSPAFLCTPCRINSHASCIILYIIPNYTQCSVLKCGVLLEISMSSHVAAFALD